MTYILKLFLVFFLYSVLGYILEVSVTTKDIKKINLSRGFLIGPYIPIYGTGAIIMSLLLTKYQTDLILLFVMGTIICTVLEYFTSYLMEKVYKLRWWDYTNEKYNLNGRVCLKNSILFGLGGVLIIKFINPLIEKLFTLTPNIVLIVLSVIFFIIFITDIIISINITFKLEINVNKYINKDATEIVKEEISRLLRRDKFFIPRLMTAYHNIKSINNNDLKFLREIIDNAKKETIRIKREIKRIKKQYKSDKELRRKKVLEFKETIKEKLNKDDK